jgi:arsenate reductase (thioredoxin)
MMGGTSKIEPLKILFVCVGNSCRSQMAEALAKQASEGRVRVWSAGSHPLGEILPETCEVLGELGISLQGQYSKGLKEVPLEEMDVVVGMGCEVLCPLPEAFRGQMIQWNIPDPYGRDLGFFRSVRDKIARQVKALLAQLEEERQPAP